MATININENETINVELGEQSSSFNTTLKDINYIPSYKEAETERRTNETNRIANENSREEYINDLKNRVSNGDFNGKDGVIQYEAGNGIKIENNVISATGGEAVWGSITGTLSNQADLKAALDNKANASDIPTKVSELSNDTNFITKTVDNLINYYKKSEIYTQDQVNILISNVNSFNVEVVQILPTENIDVHTIYLVPKKAEANDNYDEYIYINSSWEHIGSTSVDLTNYYNKNEIDTKLEQKQDALVSTENIKTINNNSILGSGNIDVSGSPTGDTLPIGSMLPYGNVNPPANWLVCDGSAVSRTTYADLFSVIGTTYGEGDGSTTFNLPNKKGRVSAGYDATNSQFNTLGKHIGEEKHTLSVSELAKHTHAFITTTGSTNFAIFESLDGNPHAKWDTSEGNLTSGPMTETGGSQPFNVIQPTEIDQWIIKAFQSSGVVANVAQTKTESDTDTYSCNYVNSLQGELLWTNSNVNEQFAGQTIAFNDNYSYYDIIFAQDGVLKCDKVYVGESVPYLLQIVLGGYLRTRTAQVNINSIAFGDGIFYNTYASGTTNNNQCIPYKIVGYK